MLVQPYKGTAYTHICQHFNTVKTEETCPGEKNRLTGANYKGVSLEAKTKKQI